MSKKFYTFAPNDDVVSSIATVGGATATVDANGCVDLTPLFEKNTVLDETIASKGTAPDAHLQVPFGTENLKVINARNGVVWQSDSAVRYGLGTASATSLVDHAVNYLELSAASTTIKLPSQSVQSKVNDLLVEVLNAYTVDGTATAATVEISGWTTTVNLATREGETLADLLAFAANERAILTFTLLRSQGNLPTYLVSKTKIVLATANA